MTRDELKQIIDDCFDHGETLPVELQAEASRDPGLRRYLVELSQLDQSLLTIPVDAPAPDLAQRIKAEVAREAEHPVRGASWLVATTGTLAIASVLIGFLFPLESISVSYWADLSLTLPQPSLDPVWLYLEEQMMAASEQVAVSFESLAALPLAGVVAGFTCGLVLLAAFNGFEVAQMRNAANSRGTTQRGGR